MSDNTEQVEQITKEPSAPPKREKDPKRVAAGKKLAEKNKQMREEHARYKAMEVERVTEVPQQIHAAPVAQETNDTPLSGGLISQLSLSNVISLVGIGLTVYTIFIRKSGDTNAKPQTGEKHVEWKEPVNTTFERTEVKSKPKPRPKFGM